ncbi:MAG: LTA synthase family protein [Muribaculaceae bacterium]|nr:LTA synthase family protein [Muribaculaceae bacterium]
MDYLMKRLGWRESVLSPWFATALNVLLLYVVYALARAEFMLENGSYFAESLREGNLWNIFAAGAAFDTPGIFYTNLLYILLMLLPLHLKERPGFYAVCKWLFIVVNSIALIANVADSVYFPYTMKRTTWDTLGEFSHESNLIGVFGIEMLRHWYLVLFVAILIWGMWKLYAMPGTTATRRGGVKYYVCSVIGLIVAGCTVAGGIRGGWLNHWYLYFAALAAWYAGWRAYKSRRTLFATLCAVAAVIMVALAPIGGWRHRDIRPIALSNANAHAGRPVEVSAILNTPFAMIRTINSQAYVNPHYFKSDEEAERIFSPVRVPVAADSALLKGHNVVIIIMESFGEEYIAELNRRVLGDRSKGYAPFMDSLARVSTRWVHTLDNGTKSIDAMPSILASIPKLGKPFVLTSSAMNPIDALPALLRKHGYETAFFHGARTGSMGFDGFARLVGFERYYGRENFDEDARFGGDKDFDGYWAIWDEPFMQYYALKMSEMKQPFMTALFSASSHHPFRVPEEYEGKFDKGTLPIHQTIGYSDHALRRFFETASKQPWYGNTLFIVTNDHTNARAYDEYRSDAGAFHGPLLIFDPSGRLGSGEREGIAQQIDIMPTVLSLVGHDAPYTAYGMDLTSAQPGDEWAVSYINDIYQLTRGDYLLQFDGKKSIGLYGIDDHLMAHNMINDPAKAPVIKEMETRLKALIQVYMVRKAR